MSDQTEDTLPTDALEAEVADLIDEVEHKAEAVEARLGDEEDATVAQMLDELDAAPEAEAPTLDDDITELIAEAERRTGTNPEIDEIEPSVAATPEPEAEPEVEAQVTDEPDAAALVDEAPAAEAVVPPEPGDSDGYPASAEAVDEGDIEPGPAAESPQSNEPPNDEDAEVEALLAAVDDAQPSEGNAGGVDPVVEELINETATEVASGESTPPDAESPVPVDAPETTTPSGDADESLDEELAAEADDAIGSEIAGEIETVDLGEALAAGSAAPAPSAEAPRVPAPADVPPQSPTEEPAPSEPEAQPVPAADSEPAGSGRVVVLFAALLGLLARPLDRLSVKQRDTVGWIAINMLFLAACVWLYTLLR